MRGDGAQALQRAADEPRDLHLAHPEQRADLALRQVLLEPQPQDLAVARLEISEKAKHAGIGAGMLGGAAMLAFFGVATLVAVLVLLLSTALDAWLAALTVAVALLALAGILAVAGKGQLARAAPPAPEQAIASVKADVEEVRAHAHS